MDTDLLPFSTRAKLQEDVKRSFLRLEVFKGFNEAKNHLNTTCMHFSDATTGAGERPKILDKSALRHPATGERYN